MMELLRFLPKSYISYLMGRLSEIVLPNPFRVMLIRWFAARYNIDVSEASRPLESYKSISDFFIRDLRDGVRPIEGEIVSPADGTLRNTGISHEGALEQIKGKNYSVLDLLIDAEEAHKFEGGRYFNIYLSPQDYHHVHSPVTGSIRKIAAIPGKLWPVNDWSMRSIDKLFAVNERVVIYISTSLGEVALVMIGATNVGKISLTFDSLITNMSPWRASQFLVKNYKIGEKQISAGERVGTFHLGSSVMLLFDPKHNSIFRDTFQVPAHILYGMEFSSKSRTTQHSA